MPTYVYRCQQCGSVLERRQRFQDPPLTACEACAGGVLQRVLQPVSVIFRGSGFYSTDHRSNPTANPGEPKPGASKDGEDQKTIPAASGEMAKSSNGGDSKSATASASASAPAAASTD